MTLQVLDHGAQLQEALPIFPVIIKEEVTHLQGEKRKTNKKINQNY